MTGDGRTSRIGRAGFTLIELLIVVAIIGIIISAILVAASDGVRRAEEKATQSLITKLGVAVEDRIDALFNTQAPINYTHRYLAAVTYDQSGSGSGPFYPTPGSVNARAQVFAQNDFIRAEFPDVFYRNDQTSSPDNAYAARYPLNFAGIAFPPANPAKNESEYFLPLGHARDQFLNPSIDVTTTTPVINVTGATGVFGASFSAAGGIYKNLGYSPKGYDGVDNTGNGYIDELGESGVSAADVTAKLDKHTHKTARSEMLYAVLVEGLGPLGSVFGRDDFTSKEIADTDGDGLPEFVDAWGEPLQFYRWPIYFGAVPGTSDTQVQSYLPYLLPSNVRQQDPYDPNQQLTAPGWWYKDANPGLPTMASGLAATFAGYDTSTNGAMSQGAMAFTTYFRSLIDPYTGTTPAAQMWDRTGAMRRRAYFSKPLILSAGPDKEPGVAQFNKNYNALVDTPAGASHTFAFPDATQSILANSRNLILIENQASPTDPLDRTGSFRENPVPSSSGIGAVTTQYLQGNAGTDDITNHNISAPGTGVR